MTHNETIQSLYAARRQWIDMTVNELGFNITSLLANMYTEESHFIFELLQNAEDVGARTAIFQVQKDYLEFRHDAERKFDLADIKAITAIGASTKKNDINKIGKFGLGIKSVFALADKFEIHSGEYSVEVKDFIVPRPIPCEGNSDTLFKIYFKDPAACDKVKSALGKLPNHVLLFLSNIQSMDVYYGSDHANSHRKSMCGEYTIINTKSGESRYLLYKDDYGNLNTKIAYAVNGTKLIGAKNSKFHVFFETDRRTGLDFLVHAPIRTTPSRENIPLDIEDNKRILCNLIDLFEKSVIDLSERGMLDTDALLLMPIDHRNSDRIYEMFHKRFNRIMDSCPIIPTKGGSFAVLSKTMRAGEKALYDMLDGTEYEYEILKDISDSKYARLNEYFSYRAMRGKSLTTFLSERNSENLSGCSDEYMLNLYKNIPLTLSVSNYEIVRTTSGAHIKAKDAFMPSDEFEYPEKEVKRGLSEPLRHKVDSPMPLDSFVKTVILPKYASENPIPDSFERDFGYITSAFLMKSSDQHIRAALEEMIRRSYIFPGQDGRLHLLREVCVRSKVHDILSILAKGYNFMPVEYLGLFDKMLTELDAKGAVRVDTTIEFCSSFVDLNNETCYGNLTDYCIQNLDDQLSHINMEASKTLLEVVSEMANDWYYAVLRYSNKSKRNYSSFIKTLRTHEWLYDRKGVLYRPDQLMKGDLHPIYDGIDISEMDILGFLTSANVDTMLQESAANWLKSYLGELPDKIKSEINRRVQEGELIEKIIAEMYASPAAGEGGAGVYFDLYDGYDSEDAAREAGKKYEEDAWDYLVEKYREDGYSITSITDSRIEGVRCDGVALSLEKMDTENKKQQGYDFLLKVGENEQLIEVKGSKSNNYHLTKSQFKLALSSYIENTESRFRLILLNQHGVVSDCERVITALHKRDLSLEPYSISLNTA